MRSARAFFIAIALSVCCGLANGQGFTPAVRDQCVQVAASHYYRAGYPITYPAFVDLVRALMRVEGGCGMVVANKDGSTDVGCLQINSTHFDDLARYGISQEALRWNDCQNILVGTWILDSELSRGGDLWTSIGRYNSKTPKYNVAYQKRVWNQLQRLWAEQLARR